MNVFATETTAGAGSSLSAACPTRLGPLPQLTVRAANPNFGQQGKNGMQSRDALVQLKPPSWYEHVTRGRHAGKPNVCVAPPVPTRLRLLCGGVCCCGPLLAHGYRCFRRACRSGREVEMEPMHPCAAFEGGRRWRSWRPKPADDMSLSFPSVDGVLPNATPRLGAEQDDSASSKHCPHMGS